ncbi:DUF1844 domain-containing protein [bacterium]|nr:DUF1844 domain-containing protein [Akkermansiaceae bacterium]MDB4412596.1 DUF1844 domain-containing protein [bacterium]MDA7862613.1 DUF1844 domain-containing protein [Akkermansiaceae bacterium]MDA7931359.1 DUF1844 domain-containing protein [Akkermansiaceae bacterium]MDB0055899.1 DUF1844 domain-containing protein [Akkermansiaceae bacterium]
MSEPEFEAPDARFSAFVYYQTQAGVMFLGKVADPTKGETSVDLKKARNVIDNLEMLREKSKGNLNESEDKLLSVAIEKMRELFVEASS